MADGMDGETPRMLGKSEKNMVAFTGTHEIGSTERWVWAIVIGREKDLRDLDNGMTSSTDYRPRVVLELAAAGQKRLQC